MIIHMHGRPLFIALIYLLFQFVFILKKFFKNREAVKCCKIISRCLGTADHLKAAVLMKKDLCRFQRSEEHTSEL